MPNRIIREAILSSEKIASLGWAEEVLYRRLMSIVDDYGRHEANPKLLRSKCYPMQIDDVTVPQVAEWLNSCRKAGVLVVYSVDGKMYLQINNFGQQQRSASKCPAPDINCEQLQESAHLDVSVVVSVSEGVTHAEADKKPSAAKASSAIKAAVARPDEIPESIWKDWLTVRKGKRIEMTETAMAGMRREAGKAGISLESAITICCENGWAAFKADWLRKGGNGGGYQQQHQTGNGRREL